MYQCEEEVAARGSHKARVLAERGNLRSDCKIELMFTCFNSCFLDREGRLMFATDHATPSTQRLHPTVAANHGRAGRS